MKKETPHSLKCRAGLADGLEDSGARCRNAYHGARPQAKAQSERAKRGLRHTDPSVASSARPSGVGSRNQMGLLGGSAPVSKIDEGVGTAWPLLAGAVFLRLQQQLSPVSNDLSLSNYNSRF